MTGIRRRPGATLMEVLIAIMILSIGMLAIMALFPIGAVNMARAINQDRGTTHGVNSDSMFRYYWAQAWNDPNTGGIRPSSDEAYGYSQEPMIYLLNHHANYPTISPTASQPGFPVLVDPVGWQTNVPGSPNQYFVAGLPSMPMRTTLRRCINVNNGYPLPWSPFPPVPPYPYNVPLLPPPVTYPGPPPLEIPPGVPPNPPYPSQIRTTIRLTTLLDDMTFDNAGQPAVPAGQVERGGRYNVAWLIQRPRNDKPDEVVLKVLVYGGRSPTDTPSPETAYALVAAAQPGQKLIQLDITGKAMPNLRHGGWIALCRPIPVLDPNTLQPAGTTYPSIEFYRVAAVNDETPNVLTVETESPVKSEGPLPPLGQYGGPGQPVVAVVFENLLEVFERGVLTASGGTGR
jgi:Prokaryotic N-terminal methylation motif